MSILKQKKKERFIGLLVIIATSISMIGLYLFSFKTVDVPYLTLRPNADVQTQVSAVVPQNHRYATIDQRDGWTYIFADGKTGWLRTNDFTQQDLAHNDAVYAVKPIDDTVSIYDNPRSTEKELGKLTRNTIYYVYYERNNWSQIVFNDRAVWVQTDKLIKK
ncbi:hypothetical protein KG089_02015 [Carnobacteriaceae bacterium zg-ZUI252]|nr:hypothetical protein [Carnobacteriaceae bacterium zg-ZUI252]MBS4770762.1 hypothetical protein [Carnobacteriaceae bacterium zg-ZUI240]QTU83479.1 hypothetical protein J7S27_02865 [Carnobacteriaceae bacterium zg-C25]